MSSNNSPDKKFVVVIAGPTASGKTRVALHLAEYFGAHIFSADSRQVYTELNIGTAKPEPWLLEKVPHHFINHISIDQYYSAGRYERELKEKLTTYFKSHDVAVVAGGTGLYLKTLAESFDEIPPTDPEIIKTLQNILEEEGLSRLQQLLEEKDPDYFVTVDKNNPHRLIRALSVSISTGQTYSSFLGKKKKEDLPYTIIGVYLDPPRELLYQAINKRVDDMIRLGLEEEVKSLQAYQEHQALKTVGYEEFFQYFNGEITHEKAIELIKQNSRRYAKRQVTWFKKFGQGKWFSSPDEESIRTYVEAEMKLTR